MDKLGPKQLIVDLSTRSLTEASPYSPENGVQFLLHGDQCFGGLS